MRESGSCVSRPHLSRDFHLSRNSRSCRWRKASFEAQQARRAVADIQKTIGAKIKAKEDASAEKTAKIALDAQVSALDRAESELLVARDAALAEVPNELDPTVPISNDERDNEVVREWGEKRTSAPELLHHHEILHMIDGYEAERGVGVAGHRAYFLKGVGVMLNQVGGQRHEVIRRDTSTYLRIPRSAGAHQLRPRLPLGPGSRLHGASTAVLHEQGGDGGRRTALGL